MKRFKVKVCGIGSPEDGQMACDLGADLIGMIFYRKSPRYVTQNQASRIVNGIEPTCWRVGVFVNESVDRILRLADKLNLDVVQLQGDEGAGDIRRIQQEGLRVIKTFALKEEQDYGQVTKSPADLVLLDNRQPGIPGGTGKTFDWSLRPPRPIDNIILAGGINHVNVAEGVRIFQPVVVDVNSSVESKPGVKSRQRLNRFMKECDRIRYGT